MSKEKFELSKKEGIHKELASLAGEWKGRMFTIFEKGKIANEADVSGTMKLVLGGRFILHEYKSSFGDDPIEGIAIYGYHIDRKKFESAWIESFGMGTAIMFSQGTHSDTEISFLGHYEDPSSDSKWGWKTTIQKIDENQILIVAENFSPEGREAGGVKIIYHRI
ncbi:hypothetical protein LPTSP3_g05690 [Leptospira kobayashii]|uniref:PF07617 family protein n=1 Tax=Leptospira kobayashii TaxID=1917830 RepID=A0ABN6KDB4_9LEPT|nr:DUF1579 domain-containing protein [Leptospira kobayashii]BDA77639.1 hypothetical protein LPTSP3_g05690 [Leptospira kobayashii]